PTLQDIPLHQATEVAETRAAVAVVGDPQAFRRWYWAVVPVLAVAAYITVLRIGFLSDDYLLLFRVKLEGFTLSSLLPSPDSAFYRPFSNLLTWQLGWYLFGSNP